MLLCSLGRLTDTNLRDVYLTRFLNVISESNQSNEYGGRKEEFSI